MLVATLSRRRAGATGLLRPLLAWGMPVTSHGGRSSALEGGIFRYFAIRQPAITERVASSTAAWRCSKVREATPAGRSVPRLFVAQSEGQPS